MRISVAIPVFNGVHRLDFLLRTIEENDPECIQKADWLVMVDPCEHLGKNYSLGIGEQYDRLAKRYPWITVEHSPEWGNIQGNGRRAFDRCRELWNSDWTVFCSDDIACSPNAFSCLFYFIQSNALSTVGLIQSPYWNSQDLGAARVDDDIEFGWPKLHIIGSREDFFKSTAWTRKMPPHTHWRTESFWREYGPGGPRGGIGPNRIQVVYEDVLKNIAFPYVQVAGSIFAVRAETYFQVGGFCERSWCFDEAISQRVWYHSDKSIVVLPGPPFGHCGACSADGRNDSVDAASLVLWEEEMGSTKEVRDEEMRRIMYERGHAVIEEMRAANYWVPQPPGGNYTDDL